MTIENNGVKFEVLNPAIINAIMKLIFESLDPHRSHPMKRVARTHTWWTEDQRTQLKGYLIEKKSLQEISNLMGKTIHAINAQSYKSFPELIRKEVNEYEPKHASR